MTDQLKLNAKLMDATRIGDIPQMTQLIKLGADVNFNNGAWSPLHSAAKHDQPVAMRVLLEYGANIEIRNIHGWTPLFYGHTSLACSKLLIAKGADVFAKDTYGWNFIHPYVANNLDIPDEIISLGDSIKIISNDGSTLMHVAANSGNLAFIKRHIGDMDISATDHNGKTALSFAIFRRDTPTIKYLLECGLDINTTDEHNSTALHIAAEIGNFEFAKYLVDKGIDAAIRNQYAKTALDVKPLSNKQSITDQLSKYIAVKHEFDVMESRIQQDDGDQNQMEF